MDKMTNGQAIFTWVHLADLHHRAGGLRHGNEPRLMLAELEHDVLRLVKKNWCPQPDAVFVSGDIAFSGGGLDGEYEAAQRWLLHLSRSLSLSPKSVFVVPGNHDVQRTEDRTPGVQRLIRALRHGDLSFEQLLNDTQARQLFERRFAAYLHFAAKFAPQNFAQPTPGDGLCFWSCPFSARGLSAQLVGLNTELLSSIEDNRNQPPLRSTPLSLNFFPSLKSASDGNCTIILGHHPINEDWLAGEIPITEIVRNRSGIYLCGHSHGESNIIRYSLNNHEIIQISAGACWRQVNHQELLEFRYNLVAIVSSESGSLHLKLWPRLWKNETREFISDTEKVTGYTDYVEIPLRLSSLKPLKAIASSWYVDEPTRETTANGEVFFGTHSSSETIARSGAPTRASVRRILRQLLRFDAEFDAFCHDCFPNTYRLLSSGMTADRKLTLLMDQEDTKSIVQRLADYAPERFEKYRDYLEYLDQT